MTVGEMVDNLANGPSPRPIGGIELAVGEPFNRVVQVSWKFG